MCKYSQDNARPKGRLHVSCSEDAAQSDGLRGRRGAAQLYQRAPEDLGAARAQRLDQLMRLVPRSRFAATFAGHRRDAFGLVGDVVERFRHIWGQFDAGCALIAEGAELLFDLVHDVLRVDRGETFVAGNSNPIPPGVMANAAPPAIRDAPEIRSSAAACPPAAQKGIGWNRDLRLERLPELYAAGGRTLSRFSGESATPSRLSVMAGFRHRFQCCRGRVFVPR